jgi:hypothetical protein
MTQENEISLKTKRSRRSVKAWRPWENRKVAEKAGQLDFDHYWSCAQQDGQPLTDDRSPK